MAKLLKCLQCGGNVSSSAYQCPHCGTTDYYDRVVGNCPVCTQPVKRTLAIRMRDANCQAEDESYVYFHSVCYNKVKLQPLQRSCTLCNAVTETLFDPCPQCGHRELSPSIEIKSCVFCDQSLNTELETYVGLVQNLIGSGRSCCGFAHNPCAEARGLPTNYKVHTRLANFLAAGEWREANKYTEHLIKYFTVNRYNRRIENFSCELLQTIDQLWVSYSNGRFGFTVQKRIWEEVGGILGTEDYKVLKEFETRVGWHITEKNSWFQRLSGEKPVERRLKYEELDFTITAPPGHLPGFYRSYGIASGPSIHDGGWKDRHKSYEVHDLAARLSQCNIT